MIQKTSRLWYVSIQFLQFDDQKDSYVFISIQSDSLRVT